MNIKSGLLILCTILMISCGKTEDEKTFTWSKTVDRSWTGDNFWANRLQDWAVQDGNLVCIRPDARKPMRTVHLVTSRLENTGEFSMSVNTGVATTGSKLTNPGASGFLIGAGASIDYRAAALIHHSPGKEGGYFIGVNSNNEIFVQDFNVKEMPVLSSQKIENLPENYGISVQGKQSETYELIISVTDNSGNEIASMTHAIEESKLNGNVALVSHPGEGKTAMTYWFNNWKISGTKFKHEPNHVSGPIISAQYTLSDNILKLNAQLMPVGEDDSQIVTLEIKNGENWEEIGETNIQELSYNALFKIENFDKNENTPYRIKYQTVDQKAPFYYEGSIRANPVEKDEIVVAGFTGNHNLVKGVESAPFNWQTQIWYPHNQMIGNVEKHNADLLFFSGDQIYEGASPSQADFSNKYRDYMYKWYLWCWAYADITKDVPSITIPDDHDVFQGNVWGAGGDVTDKDTKGGYVHGIEFVKMVERTQVSHLPDAYDPTPIKGGINTYYTNLNIGRISFAIIEDRKFKSGPLGLVTPTKSGRPDHVVDPNYTYKMADVDGATLLGERQLNFLDDWAADWKNSDMKVVLSQTIFGNMATHHGGNLKHLYMDFDSNGWPQTGRNNALKSIRKGFGFMLAGDQHLATIVNHGVDAQNDAGWSFCVPSIANFYPRAWMPFEDYGKNHIDGLQKYTGEYLDGLGNKVNVYAHSNPGQDYGVEPKTLHNRMPGYGIVKLKKSSRNITMECWPRYVDPQDPSTGSQYTGWPRTINQTDNYNRDAYAWLPTVELKDGSNPVVQVTNEQTNEIVYTLRINGNSFAPRVFNPGTYRITVAEPDNNTKKEFKGLKPVKGENIEILEVVFD